jgi:two-component system, LuxR family, sensor kinase FixL
VGSRDKSIAVQARLAPGLPDVLIDKEQIHQVIINLIRNAIDALAKTDRERTIVLQTQRADPGEVEVTVADTRPGLVPEVKSPLFQPFVTTKARAWASACRSVARSSMAMAGASGRAIIWVKGRRSTSRCR